MKNSRKISLSIFITSFSLFVFQWVVFFFTYLVYSVDALWLLTFSLISYSFHMLILSFLLLMKHHFYVIPTGKLLNKVNLANILTLFRISTLPTITFLLVLSKEHTIALFLIPLTGIAFITDLVDGALSRGTNQITSIGQYLDSISDYAMLIVISIALLYFKLLPLWFFILIMSRLILMAFGMGSLIIYQGFAPPKTSLGGKITIFATMTLYAAELLRLISDLQRFAEKFTGILEIITAVIIAYSIIDKGVFFKNEFKEAKNNQIHSQQSD